MTDSEVAHFEFISYLLSGYPTDSPPSTVEGVARTFWEKKYSPAAIDAFWTARSKLLVRELVDEFNRRVESGGALRFTLLDDIGEKIAGCKHGNGVVSPAIAFQDALHQLTPREFEGVSANVLAIAGCDRTWITPESHDQGLDAFGYLRCLQAHKEIKWFGGCPDVVFLVQAKHYLRDRIDADNLRLFIGSCECAKDRIYAVEKERYPDLKFRKYSPVALLYVTTGEIKSTAKLIARKAGVVLLGSDELYLIFRKHWETEKMDVPSTRVGFLSRLRKASQNIPQAS